MSEKVEFNSQSEFRRLYLAHQDLKKKFTSRGKALAAAQKEVEELKSSGDNRIMFIASLQAENAKLREALQYIRKWINESVFVAEKALKPNEEGE